MKPSNQANWQGSVDSWLAQDAVSNGVVVNPGVFDQLADTGQLAAGWYDLIFNISGTPTHFYFIIHHRNAANDNALYFWYTPVFTGLPSILHVNNWRFANNERVLIVPGIITAGSYIGSVTWVRRA